MENNYRQLLERLYSVNKFSGMKLGLQNTISLSEALLNPHKSFSSVHVAGSNGKGSVSTKIAASLQASGYKTGLYTSPHIACFRERIRVNNVMISEEDCLRLLTHIFNLIDEHQIPATFFEITTLLCFEYFKEQDVDFAVIETGIGGRLDATNIIMPNLSIITSVSLEHTDILGGSLELITREKAGIIKSGVPIVIGPKVPQDIVLEIASEKTSKCYIVEGEFTDYHTENNAIAKKALEILEIKEDKIDFGLKALPPCRTELIEIINSHHIKKQFILDVAHNPDGFKNLLQYLNVHYATNKFNFVIGISSNKDIRGCLQYLKNLTSHIYLIESEGDRAASKKILQTLLKDICVEDDRVHVFPTTLSTIDFLKNRTEKEINVVCGTFFIMNDVKKALGIEEPQDFLNLN